MNPAATSILPTMKSRSRPTRRLKSSIISTLLVSYLAFGYCPVWAQPPAANLTDVGKKDWAALADELTKLRTADPKQAVAVCQKFLQDHPQLDPVVGANVYMRIASLQSIQLNDHKAANETLAAALKLYPDSENAPDLARMEARELVSLKQCPDAQRVLLGYLAPLMRRPAGESALAWRQLYEAYQSNGQEKESLAILEAAFRCSPSLLDDRRDNRMVDLLVGEIVNRYLAAGQSSKALEWAKLRFVTCNFTDTAMGGATQTLAAVWAIDDMKKASAFLDALKDPSKPNPLTNTGLPPVDSKATLPFEQPPLSEVWSKSSPHDRITLLLWRGTPSDLSRAMIEAVSLTTKKEFAADGVNEVCRVFKAADLNLKRATAYVEFVKSGQGESPIPEFMKEQANKLPTDEQKGTP